MSETEDKSGLKSSKTNGDLRFVLLRDAAACLLFLLPLLFLTREALFSLSETVIGGNFAYGHLWGWNIVTLGILEKGKIIMSTVALDYPEGGSLTLIGWTFILGITVLRWLGAGLILSTNLMLYLHVLFACFCAYRLALRLTSRWGSSVVAGLAYGLSPFALSMIWNGQFAKLSHGFLPLVLLLMIHLAEGRKRWPIPTLGIVLGFSVAAGPYMGIFCALLALVGGIALLITRKKVLLRLVAAAVVALIASMPYLYYFKASHIPGMNPLQVPAEVAQVPDLPFRFIGENQNAVLSGWFWPGKRKAENGNPGLWTARHIHYLGWLNLMLAALAIFFIRNKGKNRPDAKDDFAGDEKSPFGIGFFLITAAVFFIIAHGYYLILTPDLHEISGQKITLPLFWISKIWWEIQKFTMPYRAAVVVMLCVTMLGAIGLSHLLDRLSRGAQILCVFLFGIGILFETIYISPAPYPLLLTKVEVPRVYQDLAAIDDCGGVLEVPFETMIESENPTGMNLNYMLYQLYHGHPLANYDKYLYGHTIARTGFMKKLEEAIYGYVDDVDDEPKMDGMMTPHFSYLILHAGLLDPKRVQPVEDYLAARMALKAEYPEDNILLYYASVDDQPWRQVVQPEDSKEGRYHCLLKESRKNWKFNMPPLRPGDTVPPEPMNPFEERPLKP